MNSKKILQSSIKPSEPIILASGSESRRIMLEDAGLDFRVISSEVDEDILKQQMIGMPFEEQVVKLAIAKALAIASFTTCSSKGIPIICCLRISSSTSEEITLKSKPASSSIILLLSDPEARIMGSDGLILDCSIFFEFI